MKEASAGAQKRAWREGWTARPTFMLCVDPLRTWDGTAIAHYSPIRASPTASLSRASLPSTPN
eukprot:scaffold68834_cov22-Tisochrysis_lutea.AAC.1